MKFDAATRKFLGNLDRLSNSFLCALRTCSGASIYCNSETAIIFDYVLNRTMIIELFKKFLQNKFLISIRKY